MDVETRNALVEQHLPIVRRAVGRMNLYDHHIDRDDAYQEACLHLLQAVEKSSASMSSALVATIARCGVLNYIRTLPCSPRNAAHGKVVALDANPEWFVQRSAADDFRVGVETRIFIEQLAAGFSPRMKQYVAARLSDESDGKHVLLRIRKRMAPRAPKQKPSAVCGTKYKYRCGCRCEACRTAHASDIAKYRERRKFKLCTK